MNIPENLLLSIALTGLAERLKESFFHGHGQSTQKVKDIFLKNKQQLISQAKNNLKNKIKNFDLGCMQINYYYHGHKFKNIAQMIEPEINVRWAGNFLLSLKDKHKTWNEGYI